MDNRRENRLNAKSIVVEMLRKTVESDSTLLTDEQRTQLSTMLLWGGEEVPRVEVKNLEPVGALADMLADRLPKKFVMRPKVIGLLTLDGVRRNHISAIAADLMYQAESYKKWFLTPATPDYLKITINSVIETMIKIGIAVGKEKLYDPIKWVTNALDYVEFDWKGKPTFDIAKFTDKVGLRKYVPGYSSPKDKERRMIIRLMMGVNEPAKFGRGMVLWVDAVAQNLQIISTLTSNKELAGYAGLNPVDMDNPEVFWTTQIKDFNTKLQHSFAKKYEDIIWDSLKHLPVVKGYSKEELARGVFIREIAKKIFMMWGFGSGVATLLSKAPNYAEGLQEFNLPEKEHKALISKLLDETSMMSAVEGGFANATLYKDTFDLMAKEGTLNNYRQELGFGGYKLVTAEDESQKVVITNVRVVQRFQAIWDRELGAMVHRNKRATVTLPDGTTVSKTNTRKHTVVGSLINTKAVFSSNSVENNVVPVYAPSGEIVGYFLTHRTFLMSQIVHSIDGWLVKSEKNLLKHYYGVSILSNHDAYGSHPEYTHLLRTTYAYLMSKVSKANMLPKFIKDNSNVNPTKAINKGDNYLNVMETYNPNHFPWLLA